MKPAQAHFPFDPANINRPSPRHLGTHPSQMPEEFPVDEEASIANDKVTGTFLNCEDLRPPDSDGVTGCFSIQQKGERFEESESSRYGDCPVEELALIAIPVRISRDHEALLIAYIARQDRRVLDWVMKQSNSYFEAFRESWSHLDCELAAAVDLALWQRGNRIKSNTRWGATKQLMHWLKSIQEAFEDLTEANR